MSVLTTLIDVVVRGLMCFLAISSALELTSCRTISSDSRTGNLRSERSKQQITSLKEEAIRVMRRADQPYSEYRSTVDGLKIRLRAAYNRDKSDWEYAAMWNLLLDPKNDLLGGFLRRWESSGKLGQSSIRAAVPEVADAFDQIIEVESAQVTPTDDERTWRQTVHLSERNLRATVQQAFEAPPWRLLINESDGGFNSSYLKYPGTFEGLPLLGSQWQERCWFEARFSRISDSPEIGKVAITAHAEERPGAQWPWKPTRSFERAQERFDEMIRRIRTELDAFTSKIGSQHLQ